MSLTAREIPRRSAARPAAPAPASCSRPSRAQEMTITDPAELDLIRRFRKTKTRGAAEPSNPAVGVMLSLRELPAWALMNAPRACTTVGQVGNVLNAVLFGTMDADGNKRRLTPSASMVLLTVMAVRLKLVRVVGTLDADNLAELLGYSPRQMREALRELEDGLLVVIDRERGRITQLWLAHELMDLPLRARRSYPQGTERGARLALLRRKSAALLSRGPRLDDNPLPPSEAAAAPPRAPTPSPPRPPATDQAEAPRTAPPDGCGAGSDQRQGGQDLQANDRQPVAAAPPLTNGNKRPRQPRGDHSGAPPLPSWWRSLLSRLPFGGLAPPS